VGEIEFTVIDTAGLEEVFDESLVARMRQQTEAAIDEADAAFLLIDAREGVTPADAALVRRLRKRSKPIILVANKCEGRAVTAGLAEAHALGLGEPIAISAEHGEGMGELHDALLALTRAKASGIANAEPAIDSDLSPLPEDEAPADPALAIVGRPMRQSTLVNSPPTCGC
jgi:GTP-binding protein